MKGKKFNAAEKHFQKKELALRREIAALNNLLKEKNALLRDANDRISSLETENAQQKEWIERLLQYTELSLEDVKAACEKDKSIASAMKVFDLFGGGGFSSYM